MEKPKNIIGVDLGGTNIRAGKAIDREITLIKSAPTPSAEAEDVVIEAIFSLIDACIDEQTQSIGVGVPSVVDVEKGIVYDVVNIPSWKEVHLKEILENKYKIPAYINNDANCFALGEKYFGKAQAYNSVVGLAIGTGMGSGLIFNGKLYEGANCGAGEFGNVPYLSHNFEYYCSGQFFAEEKPISAYEAFLKAQTGDKEALAMFNEFGHHLGQAIKSILYAYDPEVIVLGGSLSKSYEFFKVPMFEAIQDFAYSNVLKNLKIEISNLEHSAIYGAAALFLNKHND
jgi:glucokinase